MIAADYIAQVRVELAEKSEHWSDEELLSKLQRAYKKVQIDIPWFMESETLSIPQGVMTLELKYKPIKSISFETQYDRFVFIGNDAYFRSSKNVYTFSDKKVLFKPPMTSDTTVTIAYRYMRILVDERCTMELPEEYEEALRSLYKHYIYEKPTRNTKERDLSGYYLKLYEKAKADLLKNKDVSTAAYIPYKKV